MKNKIKDPRESLASQIVQVLRWRALISGTIQLLILLVTYGITTYFNLPKEVTYILFLLLVLLIINSLWKIALRPKLVYKNSRYSLDQGFFQLKTGAFNEERQLVPIAKIQAVSTNQGPILRRYGLNSITVETMGSSHTILGLEADLAVAVRNQIASLAKITEDDD